MKNEYDMDEIAFAIKQKELQVKRLQGEYLLVQKQDGLTKEKSDLLRQISQTESEIKALRQEHKKKMK